MDNRKEKVVRLVIVGCGNVARNIHIPRLLALPNLFQVTAVCDINPVAAQTLSKLVGGIPWFENPRRMLESIAADAMLVLTPLHYEPAGLGLEYGLDLFVEKPFCETPEQALQLAEQVSAAKKVAMVGAMRIFEPGVMAIHERLASLTPLRWVEIHDFCSRGAKEGAPKWAGDDPRLVDRNLQSALQGFNPKADPRLLNALQTVLLEFIHDLSVLRAVFGGPIGCADAHISKDGWSIAGRLSLPGEIPCNFEVAEFGVSQQPVEEVSLMIAGEGGLLRIEFGNPFVQGGGESTIFQNGMESERMRGDPYLAELLAFHRAISEGVSKWNDAQAGAADVVAAWNIVEKGIKHELY